MTKRMGERIQEGRIKKKLGQTENKKRGYDEREGGKRA